MTLNGITKVAPSARARREMLAVTGSVPAERRQPRPEAGGSSAEFVDKRAVRGGRGCVRSLFVLNPLTVVALVNFSLRLYELAFVELLVVPDALAGGVIQHYGRFVGHGACNRRIVLVGIHRVNGNFL
jgi:hypothetical protein